ncbi:MAG: cytochrome c3 family protein [Tepidisphaeraceae bacterium]
MRRQYSCILLLLQLGLAAMAPGASGQFMSVVNSPHNLSATGPGTMRASSEQQVCIFCHTPHHASAAQPLWNRQVWPQAYKPYASTSLQAKPGQPTGSSKLCLSCHDGTIALGNVVSRDQAITMAQGMTVMPAGHANIGTDLTDDHPISFRYDAALLAKNPRLKDPRGLPRATRLDANQELQCTSCHDAHNNSNMKFLVMANDNSQLCNTCHSPGVTTVVGHQQCAGCHQQHTAPSGPWLLRKAKVGDTCGQCHSGGTGTNQGANVMADISKISKHDTAPAVNIPDHAPSAADCTDCHGAHTMTKITASAPAISGRLGKVRGVNSTGAAVAEAQREYEVCFRCHGDSETRTPYIPRHIVQKNTRVEFGPSSTSFHPVVGIGRNSNVPSLLPGWSTSSMIYCSDCHGSDSGRKVGGTGPDGVHGSINPALLNRGYSTTYGTSESAGAYALCYRCHDRTRLLTENTASNPFKYHKKHVQDLNTPCSVCHDPHGSTNARLINFDARVVTAAGGQINASSVKASCTLTCHGKAHPPH